MADYSIYAELGLDTKSFDKGIKNAQSSLGGLTKSIGGLTKILSTAFAVGGIAKLAKELGKLSQSFAESTSAIAKGTGAIGEELKGLSKSVTNVMINGVGRSAQEIGVMVADLNTRFNATDKELEKLIKDFDAFASVTGKDTKSSINEVADVMGKWSINTSKTPLMLDQLTVASQKSGASVTELLSGLKSGQAIFSQFGMNVTDSIAFLGNLKKNGVESASAITGLRTALAKWSQEGKNAKEEFKNISEQIKNAKTETEAMQIAVQNFGSRSGAEMVRVLRNGASGAEELENALKKATGAVKRTDEASRTSKDAFADLKATIEGIVGSLGNADKTIRNIIDNIRKEIAKLDLEKLKSNFEDFKDGVILGFEAVKEILQTVGSVFTEVFEDIKKIFTKNQNDTTTWKDNLYKILNALYQSFQIAVETIKALFKGDWKKVFLYGKLALLEFDKVVYDALSGIANYFAPFINDCIVWINKLIEKINIAREFFGQAKYDLIEPFTGIDLNETLGINEALEQTKKAIEEITGKPALNDLKSLKQAKAELKDFTSTAKESAEEVEEAVIESDNVIVTDTQETGEEVKEETENTTTEVEKTTKKSTINLGKIISGIVNVVKKVFSAIKNVIVSSFSMFTKLLDLNIDDMLDTILKFEDKILTFFYETLPQLPQFIKTVFESLTNVFQQLLNSFNTEEFANNILDMVYSVIDGIKMLLPVVTQIFDGIILAFDKMLESFDGDKLSETILEILRTLPQKITSYISTLLEFAKTLISSLLTALTEWFESGGLMEFVETLMDMITDTIEWLVDNIDDIVSLLIRMTGQIIKTLLEKLPEIIINVIKGIPDLLDSIFKAIFDAMKDMVSGMGSFFSGIFNEIAKLLNIPGYAIGTQNAMKGLAVVGEQGPELVRFNGGEQVYNAKETSQILSGNGGNTWNITFNNLEDTSAYTMMKQLRQYNRNMALNGII